MYTKCLRNASNRFWDISLKTTNVNLIVELKEKSGDPLSLKDVSSVHHDHLYKEIQWFF